MFGERNTKAIKDFFLYNKKDAATTESIRLEGIRQLKEQRYIEANGGYFLTRVPEYAIDKFDEYPYAVLTNIVDTESRQDVPVTFATCEFICKTHEEAEEKAAMLTECRIIDRRIENLSESHSHVDRGHMHIRG